MSSNDILWMRYDVFSNKVILTEKTMYYHISKHASDKFPTTEEHVYQAVTDPDAARRSLDPEIGHETCVFEKFFDVEGERFFTTVIYDGVEAPGDYDQGGKTGRVSGAYFPGRPTNSKFIGDVFWAKNDAKPVDLAAGEEIASNKSEDSQ